jgi:hypothetical protein
VIGPLWFAVGSIGVEAASLHAGSPGEVAAGMLRRLPIAVNLDSEARQEGGADVGVRHYARVSLVMEERR